jgi:molybdopterin-guanine dinucleotide biosynthesis protein A
LLVEQSRPDCISATVTPQPPPLPEPRDSLTRRCTLAVLAGGEGTRMGMPKGLLRVAGRPILQWLLERMAWDGPTLLVTAPGRERPPGSQQFDREATDPVAGEGPLRGVHTALAASATDVVVVTTVDMPGIGPEQLRWLLSELDRRPAAAALMCARGGGQLEPFPLAVRREARVALAERLARAERSVHRLVAAGVAEPVACPPWPARTWVNLNRPEDLEAWLRG